jgi:hypothetical protein
MVRAAGVGGIAWFKVIGRRSMPRLSRGVSVSLGSATATVIVSSSSGDKEYAGGAASWTEETGFCRNPTYLWLPDVKALAIVAFVSTLNRRGYRRPNISPVFYFVGIGVFERCPERNQK